MANVCWYDIETFPNFFSNKILFKDGSVQTCVIHEDRYEGVSEMLDLYKNNDYWFTGYNNLFFDDRVIQWMINYFSSVGKTYSVETITGDIYNFAQQCINNKTKKFKWGNDVCFKSIDLMRVGYLDKSLKMVATNLEWPLIQDLPYPHDHYVTSDEIDEILDYNLNDVEITKRLYDELERDIKLRGYMSKKYGENLMSDSNSGIANKLLNKMYAEASGQTYWQFKDGGTHYDSITFGDIISDKIAFNRPNLQKLLKDIKDTTIHKKDSGKFEKFEYHVRVGSTTYKLAKGGIHSENDYEFYEATNTHTYRELDFSSYYPFLMLVLKIMPNHLSKAFFKLFDKIVKERLQFKEEGKETESDALKIVINAVRNIMSSKMGELLETPYGTISSQASE